MNKRFNTLFFVVGVVFLGGDHVSRDLQGSRLQGFWWGSAVFGGALAFEVGDDLGHFLVAQLVKNHE